MKMKNERTVWAFAFAALSAAASAAAAPTDGSMAMRTTASYQQSEQGAPGDSVISPTFGLGVPVSDLSLSRIGAGNQSPGDSGLTVGGRYLYQTSDRLSLGGEIAHTNYGDRDFVVPGLAGTIGSSMLTIEALARYWLLPPRTYNPYVIGGVGLNSFSAHVRETFDPSKTLLDDSSVGLAVSAGGGVESRFGKEKNVVAGAEVAWMLSTLDSGKFGSSTLNGMGISGRLGYKF